MKLRLGALPDAGTVKLTVTLPSTLKGQLDRYAEVYSANFGTAVDAQTLVPHMLSSFLIKDRAFQRILRQRDNSTNK
jgi:hypothetical protein